MNKFTTTLLTLSVGFAVTTESFADKIYWADQNTDTVERSDSDGSNEEILFSQNGSNPSDIALDIASSKMYVSFSGNDNIVSMDLDGSNQTVLVTGIQPNTVYLDLTNSKIYWADGIAQKIQKADLDGSNVEDVISSAGSVADFDLDLPNSKIYWVNGFGGQQVLRANLDGTNTETLITETVGAPSSIKLDLINSKLFYGTFGFGQLNAIKSANLDGSGVITIASGNNRNMAEIDLDLVNSKVYWTELNVSRIQRADFDGSNAETVISSIKASGFDLDFGDIALSVELNSFSARQIENSISLNWSTASETENEGFNIYRKTGENNFVQIASHKSHRELKGQGNTSVETFYSFIDDSKLQNGELYTYIISDVETNGLETKHEENAQSVFFEVKSEKVNRYRLAQNFPNPFNPSTTISYQIAKDTKVSLKIYNEKGDFVKELTNGFQHEGSHNTVWDGTDNNGKSVSSGTYFYKISAGTFTQTNKMILLK